MCYIHLIYPGICTSQTCNIETFCGRHITYLAEYRDFSFCIGNGDTVMSLGKSRNAPLTYYSPPRYPWHPGLTMWSTYVLAAGPNVLLWNECYILTRSRTHSIKGQLVPHSSPHTGLPRGFRTHPWVEKQVYVLMQQGLILLVACTEILQEFMSQPHYLLHLGVFGLYGSRDRNSTYSEASTSC